jgi:hypothetical protein
VTVVGPVLIGIYEAWRTKAVNLYTVESRILPLELFYRGLNELWGDYPIKFLETMPAVAVKTMSLAGLTPYQQSVLASRKEVVQEMSGEQVSRLFRHLDPKTVIGQLADGQIIEVSYCNKTDLLLAHLDPSKRSLFIQEWKTRGFNNSPSTLNLQLCFSECSDEDKKALLAQMNFDVLKGFFTTPDPLIDFPQALRSLTDRQIGGLFAQGRNTDLLTFIARHASPDQLPKLVDAFNVSLRPYLAEILPRCTKETFQRLMHYVIYDENFFRLLSNDQVNWFVEHPQAQIKSLLLNLNRQQLAGLTEASVEIILPQITLSLVCGYNQMEQAIARHSMPQPSLQFDQLKTQIAQISTEKLLSGLGKVDLSNYLFLLLSPQQLQAINFKDIKFVVSFVAENFYKQTGQDVQPWLTSFPLDGNPFVRACAQELHQKFVAQLKLLTQEQRVELLHLAGSTTPPQLNIDSLVRELGLSDLTFRQRLLVEEEWAVTYLTRGGVRVTPNDPLPASYLEATKELRVRSQLDGQTPYGFLGFTKIPTRDELTETCDRLLAEIQPLADRVREARIFAGLIEKARDTTLAIIEQNLEENP